MNNLNLKNTSYDEILKEYKKTKEFNDSIFLDSSLLELIGGKGKSKLAKKMKKGSKKGSKKRSKKRSKKGSKKKKRNNDSDLDDTDSDDIDSDSDDNNFNTKNRKTFDFDTQISKYEKKIKKLTRKLFDIKANKTAYDVKHKASDTANTVLRQLTQSGGDSDENVKEKLHLVPLPRIFPESDITSSETVQYVSTASSTSSELLKTPSSEYTSSEYSSSSSSETPSSSSSETLSSSSSETPSSKIVLPETPETQGVIGDVVRGAGKLFKYLTK